MSLSSRLACEIDSMLLDLRAGGRHVGNGNIRTLQRHGKIGLRRPDGELIRLRVDAEQQLPLLDLAIVLHPNLKDVAGDLRRDLGQERIDARL